ncbi:MAG: DUF4906 domain-containing protein [Bacteroidales bacterium]|nr:DUF4906 domain-containing protein [Bacteroidales bacterium]
MPKGILLIFVLFFFSCQKEEVADFDDGTSVKVNLYIPLLEIVETKSDIYYIENSVIDIWVLQFNGQNEASVLVKADYYLNPDVACLNLNLLTGTNQSVYFIVNTADANMFNSSKAPLNSYTLSSLINKEILYASENDNFPSQSLRMSGIYQGDIFASNTSFSVPLKRLAAKISFSYNCLPSTNPGEEGAFIKITSVALKNVPGSSSFLSNPENSTIAEPVTTFDYPNKFIGIGDTSGTVTFYMPENLRGQVPTNTSPLQKAISPPTKATYLEIHGTYYPLDVTLPSMYVVYKIYLGRNAITDYNINSNTKYTIHITFKGLYLSDPRIIVQDITAANCHIVPPGNTVTIYIGVKGNGNADAVAGTGLDVNITEAKSINVLWQSSPDLITVSNFSGSTVDVTANNSGISGNAVIVANTNEAGNGSNLWSWHIWVTNYNPNERTTYNFNPDNPLIFMDRNLGATDDTPGEMGTKGLLYQWGRKDPFPGSTTIDGNIEPILFTGFSMSLRCFNASSLENLSNTIKYPHFFYYSTYTNHDWYSTSSSNDDLWGNADRSGTPTAKTIFDPCPAGWRVPTFKFGISPWGVLEFPNFENYGSTWITPNAGFYPAAGYRNGINGTLNQSGAIGMYWSASPGTMSKSSSILYFNDSDTYPDDSSYRSAGNSIRCVKE